MVFHWLVQFWPGSAEAVSAATTGVVMSATLIPAAPIIFFIIFLPPPREREIEIPATQLGSYPAGQQPNSINPAKGAESMSEVGITVHDLLDANESTWTFATVDRVCSEGKVHFRRLTALAGTDGCWSYCGRTADVGHSELL
jgi:hypothetical protein